MMSRAEYLPLVSVVMPARDSELTIAASVKSIIEQSYPNLELLVVDDGSTDNTQAILDSFREERLRKLHGGGLGVSHARNVGMRNARGSFVTFVDSDDELEPDAIKHAVDLITKRHADMVIGATCKVWANGRTYTSAIGSDEPVEYVGESVSALIEATVGYVSNYDPRLNTSHLTGSCCRLIRRWRLDGLHFNESLSIGEDTVFNIALLRKCDRVVVTPEIWYRYHQNPSSAIYRYRENSFNEAVAMLEALKIELGDDYSNALKRRTLFQLEGAFRQRVAPGCTEKTLIQKARVLRGELRGRFWANFLADSSSICGLTTKHRGFLLLAKHRMTLPICLAIMFLRWEKMR